MEQLAISDGVLQAIQSTASEFRRRPYSILTEADLLAWLHSKLRHRFPGEPVVRPEGEEPAGGNPVGRRVYADMPLDLVGSEGKGSRRCRVDLVVCDETGFTLTRQTPRCMQVEPSGVLAVLALRVGSRPAFAGDDWQHPRTLPRGMLRDACTLAALDLPASCVRIVLGFDRTGQNATEAMDELMRLSSIQEHARAHDCPVTAAQLRQVRYLYVPITRGSSRALDYCSIY